MESTPAPEKRKRDESGIALFMVISAMTVLSLIVTEFTYIAQVNQRMAYDGLDQIKALYLAKSGFKLSLLRLKAYQKVKDKVGAAGAKAGGVLSGSVIDKIWSFPFFYPFPTNAPGMTPGDKDRIKEFEKSSGLEGSFSAVIESESSKYNLNMIQGGDYLPTPGPSSTPTPVPSGQPGSAATPIEDAQKGLSDYLGTIIDQKKLDDPDFANDYRDLKLEDLMDGIKGWAIHNYEQKLPTDRQIVTPKRAPFYSLTELHMVPLMDDQLYDLLAPALTVSKTPGVNINTMKEPTLRALIAGMTKEEVDDFFKFRDSQEDDNRFKSTDDFFKYIKEHVGVLRNSDEAIKSLKDNLQKRNIVLVLDETFFKITVQAQVNQATKLLEAWVVFTDKQGDGKQGDDAKTPPKTPPAGTPPAGTPGTANTQQSDAGLKVTFMRII